MNRVDSRAPAQRRRAYRKAVFTAPLWMASQHWSSRSIAEALNVSQSFVAQVWRDTEDSSPAASELGKLLDSGPHTVLGYMLTQSGSAIAFAPASDIPSPEVPLSRRHIRVLRAVLGAELVREDMGLETEMEGLPDFKHMLVSNLNPDRNIIVATSGSIEGLPVGTHQIVCTTDHQWQGLLTPISKSTSLTETGTLQRLEEQLRQWYRDGMHSPFVWASTNYASSHAEIADRSDRYISPDQKLSDDIVSVIRRGLMEREFYIGVPISNRSLARRVGVGRGRVERAIQFLVEEGILHSTDQTTVTVQVPVSEDIKEIYAARRSLGTIGVRAASRAKPEQLVPAQNLLSELKECAEMNDIARTQQVDLNFQNALFEASMLPRVSAILQSLSKQTLMFISAIGIDYAYSPKRAVEIDSSILEAVLQKDLQKASRAWQLKIDEGVRYMIGKVERLH